MRRPYRLAFVFLALLLTGCASTELAAARRTADAIAAAGGLQPRFLPASPFTLAAWQRPGRPRGGVLTVYFEGDGRAWINRGRLAENPTPSDPTGLRLAAADPVPGLLYLARPCQFVTGAAARHCAPRYWSESRLAPEVVSAAGAAIDRVEAETGARGVELVGYSGGGALAALVAARRRDVVRLVTVAADLDLGAWTRLHRVSPLSGSLDPVHFAAALARIPQIHYIGAVDTVVPPSIVERYRAALGPTAPLRLVVVPGFTHDCCWQAAWPRLIARARREEPAADDGMEPKTE